MLNALKQATFSAVNRAAADCDLRDTIIVAGAPRSGTTWVAELFRELDGYKLLNEPLFLSNYPKAQEAGFSWRTYLLPDAHAPRAEAYLHDALTGRMPLGPGWYFQRNSALGRLVEHATHRRLVVKFCRAGRMLRWMTSTFDVRGTVLVIRHPCAVVASQLHHGGWEAEGLVHDLEAREALGEIPDHVYQRHEDTLASLKTRLEVMTAVWCLDYYMPLLEHGNGDVPWTLLPYERLVTRGKEELERVLSSFGASLSESLIAQLRTPSYSAKGDVQAPEQQLSKWRRRLSEEQIDIVLEIVDRMGLSRYYDRAIEPDYEALQRTLHPENQRG